MGGWRRSSYSNGSETGACVEVAWRKSSYSNGNANGECVEVAWRKSSHSNSTGGACAEVAYEVATVAVRDSKNSDRPLITVAPAAWRAFVASTRV